MMKVKLLLKRFWNCSTMAGNELEQDTIGPQQINTPLRMVAQSSPSQEAWQLKSREDALAHWGYVKHTLNAHGISQKEINTCGVHYVAAFRHGWKHGVEHERSL